MAPDATAAYAPSLSFETGPFAPDFQPPAAARARGHKARAGRGRGLPGFCPRAPAPRRPPARAARGAAGPLRARGAAPMRRAAGGRGGAGARLWLTAADAPRPPQKPKPLAASFVARFGASKAATVLAGYNAVPLGAGEGCVEAHARALIRDAGADGPEHFYVFDLGAVLDRLRVWTTSLPRVTPHYAGAWLGRAERGRG